MITIIRINSLQTLKKVCISVDSFIFVCTNFHKLRENWKFCEFLISTFWQILHKSLHPEKLQKLRTQRIMVNSKQNYVNINRIIMVVNCHRTYSILQSISCKALLKTKTWIRVFLSHPHHTEKMDILKNIWISCILFILVITYGQ